MMHYETCAKNIKHATGKKIKEKTWVDVGAILEVAIA